MDKSELVKQLSDIRDRGFGRSFARYCSDTFSSFSYSGETLEAAMSHAHYLRLFIEEEVCGAVPKDEIPEDLRGTFREVSGLSIRETLCSESPSGMECCRLFVKKWCEALSQD